MSRGRRLRRTSTTGVLCGVLAAACVANATATLRASPKETAPPVSGETEQATPGVPFEVIAEGAPFDGPEKGPITLAVRADEARRPSIRLPDEVHSKLDADAQLHKPILYVMIFAGPVGSSGYRVRVESITKRDQAGRVRLTVAYRVEGPPPGAGAAAVITYPYVVVRVVGLDVDVRDVAFEES